jgi:Zn-dependent protease
MMHLRESWYTTYMFADLPYGEIPYIIGALLVSLGFHEAMHAYTAHRLGDTTAADEGRLTLNPFKHVDLITTVLLPLVMMLAHLPPILIAKPVPFDPSHVKFGEFGSALIALAGPFTNLALAALTSIAARAGLIPDGFVAHAAGWFIIVNISLFVFNMLPIPPLDGSRLLYAFAPEPIQKIMYQVEQMGFIFIVLLLVLLFPVLSPILSNINQAIYTFLL